MNKIVKALLDGRTENHMLPFFWQHGESEEKLREYVKVIQDANCGAFCVESRPHPDFCGAQWWHDMDVILDEAEKHGMKVWILDDSHFPTGYANGALENADAALCRQSLFCRKLTFGRQAQEVRFEMKTLSAPPEYNMSYVQKMMSAGITGRKFDDDHIISITAFDDKGEILDLTGKTQWAKPEGNWTVAVCGLSRNCGPHRNSINMMNRESVRELIKAVYEPHYEHYGELFGSVIAGFFSDEPELGNGIIYERHNVLGTEQDLPWSDELQAALEQKYGEEYKNHLPLLWLNDFAGDTYQYQTEKFRIAYMDMVSELVSRDFSQQLGNWCHEHGVMYIGHLIEDCDTHTCTGSGLGHFFRGIAGQDMSGIDDIGGQVVPQGEDGPTDALVGSRNGGFYHYTLGKLGVSAAYLDEKKQGRTMCEIFGAYGWKCGVSDMKYLADHFLVRGVNYFVPHAFSPKDYPDPDCPPHFYANGNNPQYQFISDLFAYMNRVGNLISGGEIIHKAAILYNAEADWTGNAESMDKTARILYDHQIDYSFLPMDLLDKADEYEYILITPCKYVPKEIQKLKNAVFVDDLPENLKDSGAKAVKKEELPDFLKTLKDADITPENPSIHVLHYRNESDIYIFNNEGSEKYSGRITVPVTGECYCYDAWNNRVFPMRSANNTTSFDVELEPRKLLIIVFDKAEELDAPVILKDEKRELSEFERSICRAADYPYFGGKKAVTLPDHVELEERNFSGFIRYSTEFSWEKNTCVITITEPAEGVTVFVNGVSAGRQVVPDYVFDLTDLVRQGTNQLVIETATSLERENEDLSPMAVKMGGGPATSTSGLIGHVFLQEKREEQIYNPFLPLDEYIPDGEPHVFGDRIYLFGSHDQENGETFCMLPYRFYSAPLDNLAGWTAPDISYSVDQDPNKTEQRHYMYAPDVVEGNDGKYYLYYCLGGYQGPISVAVSDTPEGGYQYLGNVRNPDGTQFLRFLSFDPAVINDDGTIRLYFGAWFPFEDIRTAENSDRIDSYQVQIFGKTDEEIKSEPDSLMGAVTVEIGSDMLTVISEPKRITPVKVKGTMWEEHPFFEGSSIRKIGAYYYFIYSSFKNHELCYALSRYPDRDFAFKGTIISTGDVGVQGRTEEDRLNATGTTHGSIECIDGKWYVFYHRLTHGSDYSRQACAEEIHILDDGSIPQVECTSCGLNGKPLEDTGIYPAVICCNLTNRHMPHGSELKSAHSIPCISSKDKERFIHDIENGTWIGYKYFDFRDSRKLTVTYRSSSEESAEGSLFVSDKINGERLAGLYINDSGTWQEASAQVSFPKGKSALFFCYEGMGKIDLLSFELK